MVLGLPTGCQVCRRGWVVLLCAAALVLAAAVSAPRASAAVTIGSDLSVEGAPTACPFGDCTVVQTVLPGRQVTSPIDGVVVRWRVRNAFSPGPVRFRVVRGVPGAAFTGGGSAESPGFSCTATCTVNVRLPISAGDHIGIDAPGGALAGTRAVAGAGLGIWSPFLGNGEARLATASISDLELLLNADVEADADGDGYGDESQDLCPSSSATQRACGKATIAALARSVAINTRTGRGAGRVRCTNVAGDVCRISLSLRARTGPVGTAKGTIAGGASATLRFKLSSGGLAKLRAADSLRVRAVGSSRNRIGAATRINKPLTLKPRRG